MNQLPTWHDVIGEEKQQSYFVDTLNFVEAERAAGNEKGRTRHEAPFRQKFGQVSSFIWVLQLLASGPSRHAEY